MDEDENDQGSPRGPLIALIVVVLLIGAGFWITQVLRGSAAIQDCVTSGRTNCAPIQK